MAHSLQHKAPPLSPWIQTASTRNNHPTRHEAHHALTFKPDQSIGAGQAAYRRRYWQGYAQRVKRVFGSITPEEYQAVKARAEVNKRSVWGQIWAESKAYNEEAVVLTPEIVNHQRQLVADLRRIGNNINQLAKLGHIRVRKHGGLAPRGNDKIGVETVRQMEKLEALIVNFGRVTNHSVEQDDDH